MINSRFVSQLTAPAQLIHNCMVVAAGAALRTLTYAVLLQFIVAFLLRPFTEISLNICSKNR